MPEELPGVPITAIPATSSPNSDLPSDPFASLQRIAVTDTVGPSPGGANRQETALEKRDETLRTGLNAAIAAINDIDQYYLRRDGTTQQDSVAGVEGNMPMNGHILTGLGNGVASTDSTAYGQLTAAVATLNAAIAAITASLASYALAASVPLVYSSDTSLGARALPGSVITVSGLGFGSRPVWVRFDACAGGGGGGNDNGGGGGGGASVSGLMVLMKSTDTITYTLGAGGLGTGSGTGGTGGNTTLLIQSNGVTIWDIVLGGGLGGTAGTSPGPGGAGGDPTLLVTAGDGSSTFPTATGPNFGSGMEGGAGVNVGAESVYASGGASAFANGTWTGAAAVRGAGGGGGTNLGPGYNGGAGFLALTVFPAST